MPGYAGTGQAKLLRENQQMYLFQDESGITGRLSFAFELARVNRSFYPWGISFEVMFSAAPGVFEVDIVGANNDFSANFVTLGTITAVNSTNVGRWDMPTNMWPKYIAAIVKTLSNAVNTTLQVTR